MSERASRLSLLGAALAAFAVFRLLGMGQTSLGVDDGGSVFTALKPLGEIFPDMMRVHEVHPPLYFYWIHPWVMAIERVPALVSAVGGLEIWLRLSNVGWLLAVVILTYLLARDLLGRGPAVAATAMVIASNFLGYYGWEIRMYPMVTALVLAAACLALRLQRPDAPRAVAPAFAATCILAFFTHYLTSFYIAALCLYLMLVGRREHLWLAFVPIAAAVAAWWPVLRLQMGAQNMLMRDAPGWADLVELGFLLGCGIAWPVPLPSLQGALQPWSWLGVGVWILVACGMARAPRDGRLLLGLLLAVPLAAVFAISDLTPTRIFEYKYFQLSAPFAFVALAALARDRRGLAAVLLMVAVNLVAWRNLQARPQWYGPQDWRGVVAAVAAEYRAGDRVVVHPSMMAQPVFVYGALRAPFLVQSASPGGLPPLVGVDEAASTAPPGMRAPTLAEIEATHPRRIWFLTTPAHPYVRRQDLLRGLLQRWRIARAVQSDSFWPANRIQVLLLVPEHGAGPGTSGASAGRSRG